MLCWFYRLMISHSSDADTPPSSMTQKHIRHCSSCRRFYQTCQSLAEGLRREAAIANDSILEGLSERTLTAIPGQRKQIHKITPNLWIAATAACLALAVLIGALLLVTQTDDRKNGPPNHSKMATGIQELLAVYEQVGQDIPKTWPAVIDEPLANELENLTNDTQSAVRFLVACVTVDIADNKAKSIN